MATKKKKSTKKKKAAVETVERSPFWALSGAVLLVVFAAFLLLGGFGTGGPLPVSMFNAAYWLFGWAAYLTPIALAYWGIHKFRAEDHRIPLHRLGGMTCVLLFSSGFFYVAFATKDGNGIWRGGHGGAVGQTLGSAVLTALDKIPATTLFAVLTFLAICFAFGVSVKSISKLAELFKLKVRLLRGLGFECCQLIVLIVSLFALKQFSEFTNGFYRYAKGKTDG